MTPRRAVLAVAVLLALAGAALWATRSDDVPAAPTESAASSPAPPERRPPRTRAAPPDERAVAGEPADAPPVDAKGVDSAADESGVPGQWVVRLLDARGEPTSGVWIQWEGGSAFTDSGGEVSIPVERVPRRARFFDGEKECKVPLDKPVTVVRVGEVRRVAVGVVDGSTGALMPDVHWRASGRNWREGQPADSRATALPLVYGSNAKADIRVEPPEGFGALDPFSWGGEVAERAKSVRVLVPVFPARELLFRTVDADGRPVAGAEVASAQTRLPGEPSFPEFRSTFGVTHRAERSDETGLLRIRGLPRIPFARLRVRVAREIEDEPSLELGATSEEIPLDAPGSAEAVTLVLVRRESSFSSTGVGAPTVCRFPSGVDAAAPLVVRVMHRDGVPASRVTVRGANVTGVTDREGCVRFDAVKRGVADFAVYSHGFLATAVRVDAGRDSEIVVRESEPRTLRVRVEDEAGRALPAACVTARCKDIPVSSEKSIYVHCSVAQVTGDVELATPLTDREGTVVLSVPAGTIEVTATLGAARASVQSKDDFVRVVLRPPAE